MKKTDTIHPLGVRFPESITRTKLKKQAKKRGFVINKKGNVNAYIVNLVKNDLNKID